MQATHCLPESWDGYGAAAPREQVIGLAQELVRSLGALLPKAAAAPVELHVSPTRVGGILIDWEDGTREHEIDLSPDGSIGSLHRNKDTGQIETRRFSASIPSVVDPGLLAELRQLIAA